MKTHIKLLVVDLDNTLYDWVTFFSKSFSAMVKSASAMLAVDESLLLDELQAIHRKYHNSEQPFALLETPSVLARYPGLDRRELSQRLSEPFQAFSDKRDVTLKLYPSVKEALSLVHERCKVVGHTEASVTNAVYRLRKLGIGGLVEPVYALRELGPAHPDPERAKYYASLISNVRILDEHERKPDMRVLLDICRDQGVSPSDTLYVGDSVSRDVGMAKSAGARAAWARYGTLYDPADWATLVRVTHWTADDVERTSRAQALYGSVQPDVILDSFGEICDHFTFG